MPELAFAFITPCRLYSNYFFFVTCYVGYVLRQQQQHRRFTVNWTITRNGTTV